MKKKLFLVCSFLVGLVYYTDAMGGYSDEVHTSFSAGPGYEYRDSVYFLMTYHLYKVPQGIRRFPDGGIAKTVFKGLFLMKLNSGQIKVVGEFPELAVSPSMIRSAGVLESDTAHGILFVLNEGGKEILLEVSGTGYPPVFLDAAVGYKPFSGTELSIQTVSNTVKASVLSETGLHSPLSYVSLSERQMVRALVELKGDLFFRKEIIKSLNLSKKEVLRILELMDDHQGELEGSKAMEYRIFSEDTKNQLKQSCGLM